MATTIRTRDNTITTCITDYDSIKLLKLVVIQCSY